MQVFPSQDFMRCLKIRIELADFKDDGRRFQVKLPLKVKEFMPNFCDLVEGNIRFIPDLRSYLEGFGKSIFHIKVGFKCLRDLKTSTIRVRRHCTCIDTPLSLSKRRSREVSVKSL